MAILGHTMGIEATKNLTDSEAVQHTLEIITKTILEFFKADMRNKLKECQQVRVMSYQHIRDYTEGNKV